jgi:putative pyruvate formate lyase activating enzyme
VLRQTEGARSLCFIGGDPVPHIPFILPTLAALGERKRIPAVLNSNFYLSADALALLDGAIDIYLPDLKFGPATGPQSCGEQIGGMPDYWRVVTGAIDQLYQQGARLLIRHLLMPGHWECCTVPILHWLTQYLAPTHARGALAATLSQAEIDQAQQLAQALQLNLVS